MTHCVHPSKGFVLFDNVVLHVLILFVLLSALFVFYIQKLTSEGFNTEFSNIVDEIVSPDMINKILEKRSTLTNDSLAELLKINTPSSETNSLFTKTLQYLKTSTPAQINTLTDDSFATALGITNPSVKSKLELGLTLKYIKSLKEDQLTNILTEDSLASNIGIKKSNSKVQSQLTSLVEYLKNLKPEDLKNAKSMFTKMSDNYKSNEDPLRKETNEGVKTQMIIVVVFLVIIAFIINILSRKFGNCGVLKHLGIELLIVFLFIGGIEYWFFTNVAKKYVPVHVDILVKTFKERMVQIINGTKV